MAVTGQEIRPREVDNNGITRTYYLQGCESEEDVYTWIENPDNLPPELAGFPIADFNGSESDELLGAYTVQVKWGIPEFVTLQPNATVDYRFNFKAPGGHIYQSLETLAVYKDKDILIELEPNNFGGSINVVYDDGLYRVEGLDLNPPEETFTLAYQAESGEIDGAYQALVRSMCGKVNSVTYRGEPPGSLMLVRTSGGRDTKRDWSIEFGFAYIE
jgi:hypothetical protein